MSRKYKFRKSEAAYFVSFATVNWVDVFTREIYLGILADSLTYCRKYKGMELYAYVFMPNHVHLLFRSLNEDPSGLMRDFKGFTSRKLIQAIKENPRESRKEYLLKQFKDAGSKASNVTNYQFWQQNNKPIEVYSQWVVERKVNYIPQEVFNIRRQTTISFKGATPNDMLDVIYEFNNIRYTQTGLGDKWGLSWNGALTKATKNGVTDYSRIINGASTPLGNKQVLGKALYDIVGSKTLPVLQKYRMTNLIP